MKSKILRELCELTYQSCKIELDGANAVDTDKLPGVLLGIIDAYVMGTSKAKGTDALNRSQDAAGGV